MYLYYAATLPKSYRDLYIDILLNYKLHLLMAKVVIA